MELSLAQGQRDLFYWEIIVLSISILRRAVEVTTVIFVIFVCLGTYSYYGEGNRCAGKFMEPTLDSKGAQIHSGFYESDAPRDCNITEYIEHFCIMGLILGLIVGVFVSLINFAFGFLLGRFRKT